MTNINQEILRVRDMIQILKLSRSTIWRRIKTGDFPKPFVLGGGDAKNAAIGWKAQDVANWIERRSKEYSYSDK